MLSRALTVALVLAFLSPLPMLLTPGPGEVVVSSSSIEWHADLLSPSMPEDNITVVDITGLPDEEQLTYISLQGLVNKRSGSVYLIQLETDPYWLDVLKDQHGIGVRLRGPLAFANEQDDIPQGFVVVDPGRGDTVNVATTIAGVMNYLIVYPSKIDKFREIFGPLPVIDLGRSPWRERTGMSIYTYAHERYFSLCNQRFMGFYPDWIDYGRDLLIANSAFAFYAVPGPFSDPFAWEEMRGLLRATPHTHALVGSIEPYIAAEEDFAVRDFSLHGKYFVPCSRVPNLSLLSTFPQTEDVDMGVSPAANVTLEKKHYVTVGVEDGDNIAFLHDRMAKAWLSSGRGDYPLTWSVPPYLDEFAPPFLDYYYSTRSENDSFMMSPSGAGLVFPDYLPDSAYYSYMEITEAGVDSLNFSFIWVLNGYRTYEVKYTDGVLADYAEMGFQGMVLDYDDMPWHDQYIIAGDSESNAPAIRSTQLWQSVDNLKAKMDVTLDAYPERPLFTFLAYNPWSVSLTELGDVLDDMDVEIVDMATFFELIRLAAFEDAERAIDAFEGVPTSIFFMSHLDSAEERLENARDNDDPYGAWRARKTAEVGLGLSLALFLILITAIVSAALVFLVIRPGKGPPGMPAVSRVLTMTLLFTGFVLMYYRVQFSETGNYFPLTVTMIGVPVIGRVVMRKRDSFLVTGLGLYLGGAMACYLTWWAFPVYAFGLFMLLDRTARGHMDEMVVALSVALSISILAPQEIHSAVMLALLTPLVLHLNEERVDGDVSGNTSVFAPLLLPLVAIGALMMDSRYMVQRFDYFPLALVPVSVAVPLLGLAIGWLLMDTGLRRRGFCIGMAMFLGAWALVPFLENLTVLSVLLLIQQTGMVMMVLEAARRGKRTSNPMYPALGVSFFVFYNMAFYTTPVIMDVYFLNMGYTVNYVLYHHPLFFVLLGLVFLLCRILERFLFARIVDGFRRMAVKG